MNKILMLGGRTNELEGAPLFAHFAKGGLLRSNATNLPLLGFLNLVGHS